jgi:hypothetical protein
MSGVDPDDPFGDKAFLAAQRAGKKGGAKVPRSSPSLSHDDAQAAAQAAEAALREATNIAHTLDQSTYEAIIDEANGVDDGSGPADYVNGAGGSGGGSGSGGSSGGSGARGWRFGGVMIPRVNDDGAMERVVNSWPNKAPVIMLGHKDNVVFALDPSGQLKDLHVKGLQQGEMEMLFAPHIDYLERNWPQATCSGEGENRTWNVKGYHLQYARQAMIIEATRMGLFDPAGRVRGRGCWKDDDGRLIHHVGDVIIVGDKAHKPGIHDGKVYPAREAISRPTAGNKEQFHALIALLQTWNLERGEHDALLLLGWMGACILGGALDWRAMVFVLGDAASGKSSLQKLIRAILEGRLKSTVKASPAALRAMIGQDSLGVSFDEIEADDQDHGHAKEVLEMARFAASGDAMQKGTKDQGYNEYKLFGAMLFSAINPPHMTQAERQRFTFVKVNPFPKGTPVYKPMSAQKARELGQALVGRMVGNWSRWEDTYLCYKELLIEQGHPTRGAENYATMLAAADILLHDDRDPDRANEICRHYAPDKVADYEMQEQNFAQYWRHLLSAQPEVWRAAHFPSVGEIVGKWLKIAMRSVETEGDKADLVEARKKLERAGLSVVQDRVSNQYWLAVPNVHSRTRALFDKTVLFKGGWHTALRYGPRYDAATNPSGLWRVQQVVVDGVRVQCTQICLNAKHDFGDGSGARMLFELREGE